MSVQIAVNIVFAIIVVAGIALAWFWQIAPSASARRNEARLQHISARWMYFVAMAIFVVVCGVLLQAAVLALCKWRYPEFQVKSDFGEMIGTGGLGVGVAASALYARRFLNAMQQFQNTVRERLTGSAAPSAAVAPIALSKILPVGAGVFCIVIVATQAVSIIWNWLLDRFGVPSGEQDLVQLFRDEHSPARLLVMVLIAVVIAPMWEEIIFRGALFGYLRTRLPRVLAFMLPALAFAIVHLNARVFVPLFVLALIHSKAYEHTGRIGVTIVSHALFNLATICAILLGVET